MPPKLEVDAVTVKLSPIHGRGVFAGRSFSKGEVVLSWSNTRELTQSEHDALPSSERKYIDIKNGRLFLIGEPERCVNHSCEANLVPGELCDVAARDIALGEELTTNYAQYFVPDGSFKCTCGMPRCLGHIEGLAKP